MRTIEVSTDVFAKIWSHRSEGEENEDAILRRILAVRAVDFAQRKEKEGKDVRKILWRDDVWSALEKLGGSAPLVEIYRCVREIRRAEGRRVPASLDAIVRRELEYNSSDSESFTERYDWFRSVHGIGAGVWALRV